jgi:hypothetical protein
VEGSPQAAIDAIAGRIWRRSIESAELAACQQRFHVVSTHLVAGRTEIRVWSDARPDATFTPAEANLEDVYFMRLAGDHALSPSSSITR